VLKPPVARTPQLSERTDRPKGHWHAERNRQGITMANAPFSAIIAPLQKMMGQPVFDETGLKGNYDVTFNWTDAKPDSIAAEFRTQLGIPIEFESRKVEFLIVTRK
jgi:uncharacterized protein (TIGR03435 family)